MAEVIFATISFLMGFVVGCAFMRNVILRSYDAGRRDAADSITDAYSSLVTNTTKLVPFPRKH